MSFVFRTLHAGEVIVPPMITAATRVVVSKDQVSCTLGSEVSILSLQTSMYYGLRTVGARVWSLIQDPTCVAAVTDALLQEYDVDPERCERDVIDLLQALAATGLIEIRDGTVS
jgi:hypothetical protein